MLNWGGVGGADNVLEHFKTGFTELVAVVDMLHMLAYDQQGGGGGLTTFPANHNFKLESHGCQSKWMSMLQKFWTGSTTTSLWSLSLESLNFKFATRTRAANQPVANFLDLFGNRYRFLSS